MSSIKGKTLFFTTSPRTPQKMIPEIRLLAERFSGKEWNKQTQIEYMYVLMDQDFYCGSKELKDPAFSARDRVTRAPKALGMVELKPEIGLTDAGNAFVNSKHAEEPLLRQLLKFQLPSPFHTIPDGKELDFWVKPYLEIIRLIRHFGSLTFDEVQLFGMQLTNYRIFDVIVAKIEAFRRGKASFGGSYRKYFAQCAIREISDIYSEELSSGNTSTRESSERTVQKFISTKKSNLRDYTDACFRYLRATAIVNISQSGRSLSIASEKVEEVDYFLRTIPRDPIYVDDRRGYKKYLFDPAIPQLYSDDVVNLKRIIHSLDAKVNCENLTIVELKDLQHELLERKKDDLIREQTLEIKDYKQFDDIVDTFEKLVDRDSYYDRPLVFEWNTWRAMTMIDGGSIHPNLHFDDQGLPLSTAAGNLADIVCDYGDFILNVEVTLQAGQKQYDNEGEPVARHVGKVKEATGKPTFCFFIAPTISDATKAHFFALQHTPIRHYGGKANILPLELNTFEKMVLDSKKANYVPEPQHIRKLVDRIRELAETADDEIDWFEKSKQTALRWLEIV